MTAGMMQLHPYQNFWNIWKSSWFVWIRSKEFQRVLFQVKAFEHAAPDYFPNIETPYYFEAPVLERMSAEQI